MSAGEQHDTVKRHPRRGGVLRARVAARLRRMRATAGPPPDTGAALPSDTESWQTDLNRVQLTGRLAREPLLRDVGDHHLAELQLVSERRWRTAPGNVVRVHSWHRLTAWEDLADLCGRLLRAGDRVYVEGQLRPISGLVAGAPTTAYELVLDRVILLTRARPYSPGTPDSPANIWPESPW